MTEPTPVTVGGRPMAPGVPAAPSTPPGLTDTTIEAGLEIKVRSQWDYARTRFLRHRLAMAGLIGLIILFGAGIFANFIAPYSYSQIDLNNILAPPTLTGHHFFGTDEIGQRRVQPRDLRHPHLPRGRRLRRRPVHDHRTRARRGRRLLRRL